MWLQNYSFSQSLPNVFRGNVVFFLELTSAQIKKNLFNVPCEENIPQKGV